MITLIPYPQAARGITIYRPTTPHPIYTPDDDLRLLLLLLSNTSGPILELGCHQGATTFNFAVRAPHRQVVSVDWTGHPTMCPNQLKEQPGAMDACEFASFLPNVTFLNLNMLSTENLLVRDKAGFVFIDGDHQYESVKANTRLAMREVHSGGIIAWHDYPVEPRGPKADWIGVPKLLRELSDAGMVIEACAGTMVAFTRVP